MPDVGCRKTCANEFGVAEDTGAAPLVVPVEFYISSYATYPFLFKRALNYYLLENPKRIENIPFITLIRKNFFGWFLSN